MTHRNEDSRQRPGPQHMYVGTTLTGMPLAPCHSPLPLPNPQGNVIPHHRSPRDSEGGFPSHRVEAPPPPWSPQCPHRLPVPSREGKRENHTSVQKYLQQGGGAGPTSWLGLHACWELSFSLPGGSAPLRSPQPILEASLAQRGL